MKGKLSFAQRLVRESNSNDHSTLHTPTSIDRKQELRPQPQKTRYMQFKQQHNELQSMLKLFENEPIIKSPRPPSPRLPQTPLSPTPLSTISPSPLHARKLDRNNEVKRLVPLAALQKDMPRVKENIKDPKWLSPTLDDFRSFNSVALPRTTPTIPTHEDPTSRTKRLRKQEIESKMAASIEETEEAVTVGAQKRKLQKEVREGKEVKEGKQGKKRGIPNIGNTCYINALVQCLFHLPHFNDYFAQQRYLSERNGRNQDVVQLYRALYLAVMRRGSESQISTLPLKKSVSKICSLFIDWQQQDAHEFMKELLNSMHEDLNRVKGKPNYKHLSRQVEGQSLPLMAGAFWEYYKLRDDSYIYDSLCGQLYNNIQCINCQHQSESFQNFLDLSVPMVPGARSVEDLLESFFSPEKLADFYMCGDCGKSAKKSTKTVELWRVPRFLIIQLKRPQFGKKNTQPITVPQSLSLRKFMGQSTDRSAKYCQYSLSGAVMHRGVLQGGHYWCNVKQGGQWYEIDDERTAQLDGQLFKKELTKTGSSSAYILFYSSLYC